MGKIVQLAIVVAVLVASAPINAAMPAGDAVLALFAEGVGKAETSGFAIGLRHVGRDDVYMQAGLSYQRITLKQYPTDYDGGRFRPVFLYGRLGLDWPVGPYVHAGFDLNSSLMNWLDTNDNNCCNANVRAGLEFKLHQNIRIDMYGNWYNFRYETEHRPVTPIDYKQEGESRRFSRTSAGVQLSVIF
ncbi:hypothetical protein [Rheinheimera gaetbuli]